MTDLCQLRLSVALYARTSAAGHDRETVEQILAVLAAHAAGRGWEVALECADQGPWPEGPRKRLRRFLEAVRAKAVQGILRGGRPAHPRDDTVLAAAWRRAPSLATVARHLHVSRSRVRSRLQDLGLLPRSPASAG